MKSIERVFLRIRKNNPQLSDYLCFCESIRDRNFKREAIRKWFNELVDPDEYNKKDKRSIINHLCQL